MTQIESLYQRLKEHYCRQIYAKQFGIKERKLAVEGTYYLLGNEIVKHLHDPSLAYTCGTWIGRIMDSKRVEVAKRVEKGLVQLTKDEHRDIMRHNRKTILELGAKMLAEPKANWHEGLENSVAELGKLLSGSKPPFLHKTYLHGFRKLIFEYGIVPMIKKERLPEIRHAFEQFEEEQEQLERNEMELRSN